MLVKAMCLKVTTIEEHLRTNGVGRQSGVGVEVFTLGSRKDTLIVLPSTLDLLRYDHTV